MVGIKFVKKRITKIILRVFALWVVAVFLIQIAAPNPVVESMPDNCTINSGYREVKDANGEVVYVPEQCSERTIKDMKNSLERYFTSHEEKMPVKMIIPVSKIIRTEIPSTPTAY